MNNIMLVCSVSWYKVEPEKVEQAAAMLPEIGVQHTVCPQYFNDGRLPAMNRLLLKNGVDIAAAHGLLGPENDMGCAGVPQLEAHRRFLAEIAETNATTYTIHSGSQHPQFEDGKKIDEAFFAKVEFNLEQLLKMVENTPMTLTLENIYEPLPVLERLIAIVRKFDHPQLKMCLDTGHANINPAGLWQIFPKMADLLRTCHLHDNNGLKDEHGIPGSGNIDWVRLTGELRKLPLIHWESECRALIDKVAWQSYMELLK